MAAYDTGYEDERFQHPVGHTLHCGVCMNVLKDPVMCQQNEHLYCRACITPHLKNSQTCPTCMEPLTVETLRQASRGIRSLLAELKILCEFYDRGCREFIELGNLESHLRDCGFAPAVCSNEGCRLEVNQRDLLYHETVVCELRKVQCHSCSEIKQEMEAMKVRLAAMDEKLERNMKQLPERLDRLERNGKMVEANLNAKIEQVQEQINMQEEKIKVEIKKSLNVIAKQLETIVQTLPEVQAEQKKKAVAEASLETSVVGRKPKDITARGQNLEKMADAEWKKIQQRTFTRWCNEHLKVANIVIYDLETDFCDGIKLIVLLEVLAHKRVGKYNKKPNFKSHKLENVAIALKFIENQNIKLVNIDAGDIVRGSLGPLLGLIWMLILKYQISMFMSDYTFDDDDDENGGKKKISGMTLKQALLIWVKWKMPPEIPMNNFTTDWNDGRAIAALVDAVEPGRLFPNVDPEYLDPNDAVNNAKNAMETAEKYLGVPPVLDAADMCNPKLDEKSVMTYVSYFPEAECKAGAPHRPATSFILKCLTIR